MSLPDLPEDDWGARALWSRVAEPGDARVAPYVDAHGGPAEALRALAAGVGAGPGARLQALRARLLASDPRRDLETARRCGARLVVPDDDEWPEGLLSPGLVPPWCLWVRGPLRLDEALVRSVALVGSRAATDYGQRVTADLALGLVQRRFTVVSGAAFGIDAAAHRGALAGEGPTVAVLAGGVDRPYPAAHARLLAAIAETGAVVSEVAPGCVPSRHRFLQRNRVIAALARGTVVVEAGLRSGALSTARHALALQRPVGVVPGPVTSAASAGCHELARGGGAVLVTDAGEVAELCGRMGADLAEAKRGEDRPEDLLLPRDQDLLDALPVSGSAPLAAAARLAGLTPAQARAGLARLCQAGLAEEHEGRCRLSAETRRRRLAVARGREERAAVQQELPVGR